ncbi:MAG: PLP-dependent aminotransferase family protein [Kofleriaceae bacterium]|jgi:GntR family transcriptional regulator/MocR family aminotransferase|nr:PLP-dependent aminotransferase family protein [Kofleriaceae bacterium]MBP6840610.1 PLP-dependent aminotransferase family protein [Kofleriaceae bacterium]MBP9205718.1 PLP-dependent aminotransferase family protein [Kofleriaceae bacterium]
MARPRARPRRDTRADAVALALAPTGPRFLAIARALVADLERGRWRPGQRLPSSRALAASLAVHRNTVLAALAEVEAQGWLTSQPGRGLFVSLDLPAGPPRPAGSAPAGTGELPSATVTLPALVAGLRPSSPAGPARAATPMLGLSLGMPDPRLVPIDELARAWRRVIRRSGRRLLGYGEAAGHPALRAALATLIRTLRGVPAGPEHVLVTRGSQMALDLCARALLRPGATVAVEAFGYAPAWNALRLAGARLVPIAVDGDGLDVAALARLVARRRVDAVYVTPHHQYPTTVTMSPARRLALLALARRHGLTILEDDYDHEFHYASRPVPPLAASDAPGPVVYIGTLSKVLAPGLRLGFVLAAPPVIERLTVWRAAMDRQGDLAMEAAVAELMSEGELTRHMRKMRLRYQSRRDALVGALRRHLGDVLTIAAPAGGISLWAPVTAPVDVARWLTACAASGVDLAPGARYTFDGHDPRALRLVFAPWTEGELARAVATMAAALPRPGQRPRS